MRWLVLLVVGFGVGFLVAKGNRGEEKTPVARAVTTSAAPETPPAPVAKPKPRPVFTTATLPKQIRTELRKKGLWHSGCPVALSGLRLLTVSYRGFDGGLHTGALVVNAGAAEPLTHVFRRLYRMRFPIRNVGFSGFDPTASFECRQSVPSPCTGGLKSGHWSMHAYGLAVDLNPTENPYVGCGQSRDPSTKPYRNRTRHKRGMVDDRVIAAFASVGWGWGGSWAGSTKDYMHFSSTGH